MTPKIENKGKSLWNFQKKIKFKNTHKHSLINIYFNTFK